MEHSSGAEHPVMGIETSRLHLKAVLLQQGEVLVKVVENDLAGYRWLRSWLQKNGAGANGLRICMRLDQPYGEAAARSLVLMGMQVCVAEAAALEQFAHQQGLGAGAGHSAVMLAHYGADALPARWTPPSPACMELRLWLRRLEAIEAVRKQECQRLDAHLATGQQALHALLLQQIACLEQQIAQHKAVIMAHVRRHPSLPKPPELARRGQCVARLDIKEQAGAGALH